ncbi:tetratricopeptide repeat protein [Roseobacter sinensis]|uniref:Tetratricopeptide repeat protein n=1 Tax=Roseobacter sinensis TaxID=2931391 RepID=A0ABT3BH18_9RHOB|nr:tetratricopeptide repeat protein [Roseobacter sp. WL0113]MCV3272875.1 tetratricopeptide repeat protein [Roseobacter sp. WL0113]
MTSPARRATALFLAFGLAGCVTGTDPVALPEGQVDAPGVDLSGEAVDGVEVGHRLLAAGEYELAIKSFHRAALERGAMDAEILAGLGSANLGLGRLGQAETLLRRAIAMEDAQPEDWNNLGVVLMEAGKPVEAEQIFKRAFALDNGESVEIRDNLRLALAKSENSATNGVQTDDYKLVRRGSSAFLIRQTP